MKIEFRKISSVKSPFEIKNELFFSKGTFKKLSSNLVEIDFRLKADLSLICDRCGKEYLSSIDEMMILKVSDGSYESETLDIIESYDHFVDFDSVISSEIEVIKSDYHYCKNCNKTSGE